ncbi:hypothetical protein [Mucilaginibacter lappiensis]
MKQRFLGKAADLGFDISKLPWMDYLLVSLLLTPLEWIENR